MGFLSDSHEGESQRKIQKGEACPTYRKPAMQKMQLLAVDQHAQGPEEIRERTCGSKSSLELCLPTVPRPAGSRKVASSRTPCVCAIMEEKCITRIMKNESVSEALMRQCAYGQRSSEGEAIKKPTRWLSNSPSIFQKLSKKCKG